MGNLPHNEDCYRNIARQILKQVNENEWPAEVAVAVIRGKSEVDEPWTRRKDREDFLHGGHF